MKKFALTLSAGTAFAWSAALCAQPAPAPDASAGDAAKPPVAYKTVEPRVVADYPLPSTVDPRVCLEFPTRAQIIACAERYRPHRKRTQAPA
ncbi:MAG: hypothetical protein U1F15_12300 [Burkholderiales bacterium]